MNEEIVIQQYNDFRTISELLESGEISPEAFLALVMWLR